MRRLVVAFALVLLFAAGCSSTVSGSPAPVGSGAASSAPARAGFTLDEPGFSVTFPGQPTRQDQPLPEVPGATAVLHLYELPGGDALVVGVIDYPPSVPIKEPPTAALEGARDEAIARLPGGSLASSTPATVGGAPALDFVASVTGGSYRSRLVLSGRTLYSLAGVGSGVQLGSAYQAMVESFRLK